MIFVGDDWAEAHHDVYVCDDAGVKLASRRLPEGIEGMAKFHDLVANIADDPDEVVVMTKSRSLQLAHRYRALRI